MKIGNYVMLTTNNIPCPICGVKIEELHTIIHQDDLSNKYDTITPFYRFINCSNCGIFICPDSFFFKSNDDYENFKNLLLNKEQNDKRIFVYCNDDFKKSLLEKYKEDTEFYFFNN